MNETKALADFVTKTNFHNLTRDAVERAKACLLDWLGVALAGSAESAAKIIKSVVEDGKAKPESTIIGTKVKTTCMNAALANGIIGHVLELDDLHEEAIIHPAASVIPAALSIAERNDSTGEELITSLVIGYEVSIRIGVALSPSHYGFWHTTGTCGTFGATAAVAKILGLDREKIVHALGIAGTQAAGLIESFGTMSKPLNAGKAAMNGVLAAILAEKGFSGPTTVLEADKGYCQATAGKTDFTRITKGLGKCYEILNIIFKRHASCGHTHAAIDAVIELAENNGVRYDEAREIVVETYPIAVEIVGRNIHPKTVSEAKFSLPFCVATSMIFGKAGLEEFSEERLRNPEVLRLMKKVKVDIHRGHTNTRLGYAKVTVRARNGESYTREVHVPKGYPGNPMGRNELEEKFKELASIILRKERVAEIMDMVYDLDKFDNIRNLTARLAK